ncbi:hypothetical protein [Gordonia sp. NPDC003376]
MSPITEVYQFRIEGELSAELLDTFQPVWVDQDAGDTLFCCAVDDTSQMFGILARCETLGLRVTEFHLVTHGYPEL